MEKGGGWRGGEDRGREIVCVFWDERKAFKVFWGGRRKKRVDIGLVGFVGLLVRKRIVGGGIYQIHHLSPSWDKNPPAIFFFFVCSWLFFTNHARPMKCAL